MAAEALFLVVMNGDGTITTYGEMPKESIEVSRQANNFDVYQVSKQIVDEFEGQMQAERIAKAVSAIINPSVPSTSDIMKEALKERGINPEGITPVE